MEIADALHVRGMHSEVDLRVGLRDGLSYLASGYFTPPFKVANITEDRGGLCLHLVLMSSSPGILDGDRQVIRISVEEGAHLWLHTQAYQRIFQSRTGAEQSMEVRLGRGAGFCWLPHPCVPHAGAVYSGRNRVYLSSGARLIWGEVLTCGRKLSGEVFALSRYHMRTEVFLEGELVLVENVFLKPSVVPVGSMGQMEGFTHQASLLMVGVEPNMEKIGACLAGKEGILYGVTEGPGGSGVVRMLGNKAEQLFDCLNEIACMLS